MMRALFGMALVGCALVACTGDRSSTGAPATGDDPASAAPVTDGGSPKNPRILSAYHGLDELPPVVIRLCRSRAAIGQDGMPVTFSVRLDDATVTPEAFVVETASGEAVTPVCATLRPADEPLERRTVLLAGPFGTPEAPPRAVRVVGPVRDTGGNSIQGLRTTTIAPLEAGPSLVLAERFEPTTPGLVGECPQATQQVVQLTWEGGVTGPDGADLGDAQRAAVSVTLEDGRTVTPVALADDDPDNFVHACLDVATPARSVAVRAGHFHDPGDDANPATQVEVVPGVP
jgi:hypothetical protein